LRGASVLTLFTALVIANSALAQQYPTKPIRMIVPFPPGGSVDTVARLIAPKMSESLGQSVVLDNRAGASSNIGMEAVARAAPDGYTLLINTVPIVANPSLFPDMTFRPDRDFAPISLVVNGASILFVHPSVPARTVKQLIALAKARPGQLKYTSSGAGTLPHLATALLSYMAKIDLVHVAYKGGGPAMIALISGECDLSMQTLVSTAGYVNSGRLYALAVTSKKRLAVLPDVPTMEESGVPGYEFNTWVGVLAPAATPPALIKLLNEHVVKAARAPEVSARVINDGVEVVASTPDAFRATIATDTALWGKVIREMKIKAD
jgi:tripartite-type tricarboxylate transporter receptor subunit TctC